MGCNDYDDYCRKCWCSFGHTIWCGKFHNYEEWVANESKKFNEFSGEQLNKMSIFECPKCKCLVAEIEPHIRTHYKISELGE